MPTHSPTPSGRWPFRPEIVLAVVVVLLTAAVPELLARRFWHPRPEVGNRRFVEWLSQLSLGAQGGKRLYRSDPDRLWSLIPGVTFDSFNLHYNLAGGERQPIRITINGDGYRGPRVSPRKSPSTFRILCMGDSNFFGYPLDDDESFPSALRRALLQGKTSPEVEVVNAGVPGYSVLQGAVWYEQQFKHYDFDWLLLSYLNNDAWPQPRPDSVLMARSRRTPRWVAQLGGSSRAVQWAQSRLRGKPAGAAPVPRLSLEEFTAQYRALIQAAQGKGARVLILDYRAYESYEPYSRALAEIAAELHAEYVPVAERVRGALAAGNILDGYENERVRRRWGPVLTKQPLLWVYAEYFPEHLNEVGVAWLADQVAARIGAGRP
jgi:lysophospholipase L1-like esterase